MARNRKPALLKALERLWVDLLVGLLGLGFEVQGFYRVPENTY